MGTCWYLNSEVFNLHSSIFCAAFAKKAFILLVVYITDAFEEQKWENVLLVSSGINLTTKAGCSVPKEGFHLIQRDWRSWDTISGDQMTCMELFCHISSCL